MSQFGLSDQIADFTIPCLGCRCYRYHHQLLQHQILYSHRAPSAVGLLSSAVFVITWKSNSCQSSSHKFDHFHPLRFTFYCRAVSPSLCCWGGEQSMLVFDKTSLLVDKFAGLWSLQQLIWFHTPETSINFIVRFQSRINYQNGHRSLVTCGLSTVACLGICAVFSIFSRHPLHNRFYVYLLLVEIGTECYFSTLIGPNYKHGKFELKLLGDIFSSDKPICPMIMQRLVVGEAVLYLYMV